MKTCGLSFAHSHGPAGAPDATPRQGIRSALVLAVAVFVLGGITIACASEAQNPPLRVAVLDLQAPHASPWFGPAVSESLAAKLAGVDGLTLVEREQVQAILLAKQDQEPTPELLGADFLITGSVQLVGSWPDEAAQVRLTTKVVASETAKLNADAATVLDGTVGTLFTLESDLANQLARVMSLEPTRLQIGYREERSTKAKQLFGEGLLALQQAEALIQGPQLLRNRPAAAGEEGAATVVPVGGDDMASADAGPETVPFLQSAIQFLREAQQANEGAFFARAHHYEARARELLAKLQQDDDQRRQVREETIKQFRQDAADAAPAFFDLGRALEANSLHAQAIEAYQQYLRWIDESGKIVLSSFASVPSSATKEDFFADADGVFFIDDKKQLCHADPTTGDILWRIPLGTEAKDSLYISASADKVVCFRRRALEFAVYDRATGRAIAIHPLPESFHLKTRHEYDATHAIYLSWDGASFLYYRSDMPGAERGHLFLSIDTVSGETLWSHVEKPPEAAHLQSVIGRHGEQAILCFLFAPAKEEAFEPYLRCVGMDIPSGRRTALVETRLHTSVHRMFIGLEFLDDNQFAIREFRSPRTLGKDAPPSILVNVGRREAVTAGTLPLGWISASQRFPGCFWHAEENRISLRKQSDDILLWSYSSPAPVWSLAEKGGRLYVQTRDRRLVCLAPPQTSTTRKDQVGAWRGMARSLSQIGSLDEASGYMEMAELAGGQLADLYWEWAHIIAPDVASAKQRARLLLAFLHNSSSTDPRRDEAERDLWALTGLLYQVPGRPLHNAQTFADGDVLIFLSDADHEMVARDRRSGRSLWSKTLKEYLNWRLHPNPLLHKGKHILLVEEKKGRECLVCMDAATGQVQKVSQPDGILRLAGSYCYSAGLASIANMTESDRLVGFVADGVLTGGTDGKPLSYFSASEGEGLWISNVIPTGENTVRCLNDRESIILFSVEENGTLHIRRLALSSGSVRWVTVVERTATEENPPLDAWLSINGETLLILFDQQVLHLDGRSGEIVHKRDCGAVRSFSLRPSGLPCLFLPGPRGQESGKYFLYDQQGNVSILRQKTRSWKELVPHMFADPAVEISGKRYRVCLGAQAPHYPVGSVNQPVIVPPENTNTSGKDAGLWELRAQWLSLWDETEQREAGLFRLIRPTAKTGGRPGQIEWILHDAQEDTVFVYEAGLDRTFTFDRRKLMAFLICPGE